MIVKPKITSEEFYNETVSSSKKNTMYNIKFGPFSKPIFKLDACEIKYPLGRFDKIVVEHNNSDLISKLNKSIKEALGTEAHKFVDIKDSELGIKVSKESKDKVEKFQKFDVVDVLIEFNNCWLMAGKIYTSFTLKDIKESDEIMTQKETPFLFSDIVE